MKYFKIEKKRENKIKCERNRATDTVSIKMKKKILALRHPKWGSKNSWVINL